nr:recombinase family protein [Bacillus sp. 03113]
MSTEEQTKGYSVEGQIEDCIKLAGTKEVLQYVDDGYTGEIINRPALMKLQEDIENGLITRVICYDPDRLSRKLLVQLLIKENFEKHKVELQFVRTEYRDDAEGQMQFQIRGAFSEYDKAKIKHNTMTGKYRKAKKGLVVKDSNLYGYDFDKEKNTYSINEKEAKFVRMIFDYYTDADSPYEGINGIALHLTEIGAPTKMGGKVWHRQVVRQILINESYTGTYIQNRYDTVGDYVKKQAGEKVEVKMRPEEEWIVTKIPSIISQEQFEYAQSLIEQGRRRYTNYGQHDYLLSGLVRCGRCGETMTGRKRKSHGKDFYVYECRKNYAGAKNKGCGKLMSENKLNNIVWSQILELFNNPEKINEYSEMNDKNYTIEEISHIEQEIEKTKKGRKRLFKLVSLAEDDEIDLEEIKEQIRNLQSKEKELQSKYKQLTDEIKAELEKEPSKIALQKSIEYYSKYRDGEITFEIKQNSIRTAVKEIVIIDSETIDIHLF